MRKPPIIIVGASLSGMTAAAALAKAGHAILLIEKQQLLGGEKPLYSRQQVLQKLSVSIVKRLALLFVDYETTNPARPDAKQRAFIEGLLRSQQMKDRERLLFQCLQSRYVDTETPHDEAVKSGSVRLLDGHQVIAVDKARCELTVKDSEGIQHIFIFQHIVACDGFHHSTLSAIKDHPVRYVKTPYQMLQPNFAVLMLRHTAADRPFRKIHIDADVSPDLIASLGVMPDPTNPDKTVSVWHYPYFPVVFGRQYGKGRAKFNVVAELPPCIVDEADKDRQQALLLAWIKRLLVIACEHSKQSDLPPINPDELELFPAAETKITTVMPPMVQAYYRKKQQLRIAFTHFEYRMADLVSFELSDKHFYIGVGDNIINWHIDAGIGANMAMATALTLKKYLSVDGDWNQKGYAAACNKLFSPACTQFNKVFSLKIGRTIKQMAEICHAVALVKLITCVKKIVWKLSKETDKDIISQHVVMAIELLRVPAFAYDPIKYTAQLMSCQERCAAYIASDDVTVQSIPAILRELQASLLPPEKPPTSRLAMNIAAYRARLAIEDKNDMYTGTAVDSTHSYK